MKDCKDNLAIAYAVKKKAKKMAEGGYTGVHEPILPNDGMSSAGVAARTVTRANRGEGVHPKAKEAMEKLGKAEHTRVLGEMKSMPKKFPANFAEGGMIGSYQDECDTDCNDPCEVHPEASGFVGHEGNNVKHGVMSPMFNQRGDSDEGAGDMNSVPPRIRRIMMGRAQGFSEGGKVANNDHAFEYEFETPNNFDDLSLRDDLESSYTGANSGDELGNAQQDEDRHDIVKLVMKRRGKQRNPVPA